MQLFAKWIIVGIVVELRELTSEKNRTWRGYVVKVASLGATFELQADAGQFGKLAVGEGVEFEGHFDEQGGRQRFVIDRFKAVSKSAA